MGAVIHTVMLSAALLTHPELEPSLGSGMPSCKIRAVEAIGAQKKLNYFSLQTQTTEWLPVYLYFQVSR